jgi:hypothetical protein
MLSFAHLLMLVAAAAGDEINGGFKWAVPGALEPKFVEVQYTSLPSSVHMEVSLPWTEVVLGVRKKYNLKENVAGIELKDEKPVRAGSDYFRRATLQTTIYSTESMHGYCGQNIYVWFNAQGAIAGIFGGNGYCPI